jgi:hypothetical protein
VRQPLRASTTRSLLRRRPGGAPRLLVVSGQQLLSSGPVAAIASPLANFFVAGNIADRGGVRVATTNADDDNLIDLAVGSGQAHRPTPASTLG